MRLRHLALPLAFAAAFASPVHAQDSPGFLLGSAVEASQATRTIAITPETRWVNVRLREAVVFDVGGRSFAWRFDGPGARAVDLQQIAPAGLVTRRIMAYIDTSGDYSRRE